MSEPLDFDSPWKDILDAYLAEFFAFFFPEAYREIDWQRAVIPLDKELQQVVRDAALGRRLADKLVQVQRRDGDDAWVLIHIEVQNQEETAFARRMFAYYYRLLDRYNRRIMSVAVLGDERATWRPSHFANELWGCEAQFRFPIIKLMDYQERRAELEQSSNPFATVILAHLSAQETRRDLAQRAQTKIQLTRRLYLLGYGRADIIRLFHFIDWLLQLPDDLSTWFWQELESWEEQQRMPYVTSVERIGIEKGIAKGQTAIVLHQLHRKLGDVPEAMQNRILALSSDAILDLSTALFDFTTLDDVTRWLDTYARSAEDDQ